MAVWQNTFFTGESTEFPDYVGLDFPANRPFPAERTMEYGRLPMHATIEQDLRPLYPSFIDFGPHDFTPDWLFAEGQSHVSFTAYEWAEPADVELASAETYDTNAYHRRFGWAAPADTGLAYQTGAYLLELARQNLDWGDYADRPLIANVECIKTPLPARNLERNPYDEIMHTDAVNPLWPVAQVFWANNRHSLVSLTPAYIGEGHEAFKHAGGMDHRQPTNVLYSEGIFVEDELPAGHLVIADAKRLPHCRPDLSEPLVHSLVLRRPVEPTERYYMRAYIAPLRRPNNILDTSARTLAETSKHYGQDVSRI